MNRREVIALFGGAAAAWPLAGQAQQAAGSEAAVAILEDVSSKPSYGDHCG